MKLWIQNIFWLLPACAALLSGCHPAEDHVKLLLDQPFISFGEVLPGQVIERDILLTNSSRTHTIDLVDISKSCGCTSAQARTSVLKPKSSTKVHVRLSTDERSGTLTSTVTIIGKRRDSPETVSATITLTGEVVEPLAIDPKSLVLGKVFETAHPLEKRVHLSRANSKVKWSELRAISPGPEIKVQPPKRIEDGYLLEIILHPQLLPIGLYKQSVAVELREGDSIQGIVRIPVTATITSPVHITPTTLYFGTIKPADEKDLDLNLSEDKADHFKLLRYSTSNPHLEIIARPTKDPGRSIHLRCRINARDKHGDMSGILKLVIQSDKEREIIIPYLGYVR